MGRIPTTDPLQTEMAPEYLQSTSFMIQKLKQQAVCVLSLRACVCVCAFKDVCVCVCVCLCVSYQIDPEHWYDDV